MLYILHAIYDTIINYIYLKALKIGFKPSEKVSWFNKISNTYSTNYEPALAWVEVIHRRPWLMIYEVRATPFHLLLAHQWCWMWRCTRNIQCQPCLHISSAQCKVCNFFLSLETLFISCHGTVMNHECDVAFFTSQNVISCHIHWPLLNPDDEPSCCCDTYRFWSSKLHQSSCR